LYFKSVINLTQAIDQQSKAILGVMKAAVSSDGRKSVCQYLINQVVFIPDLSGILRFDLENTPRYQYFQIKASGQG